MRKLVFILLSLSCLNLQAKVSEEEAERLGEELTEIGSEIAGLKDGPHGLSIPDYDGGWVVDSDDDNKRIHAPDNPFKDEQPLFVITAANHADYADILTEGQKGLFKQYPDTFKMKVYPTHRTAAVPEHVSESTKENATKVVLNDAGSGFEGTAHGFPFPLPQNGREMMWNHMARFRTTGFRGYTNSAITTASGDYVVERSYIEAVIHYGDPKTDYEDWDNEAVSILRKIVAPPNKAGEAVLIKAPLDRNKSDVLVWVYNLGTRKTRRIGEIGYDNPIRDGLMIHDQVDMFNGPLDRYSFNLVGKKPVLVPYNSFDLHSKDLKYKDLLHKGHVNPDVVRYELHRMWVVEATRLDDVAHIYKKRVFYIDEDSWLILLQDIYDDRDEFWRTAMSFAMPYPQVPLLVNAVQAHYDLQSRRYVLINMQNEEENAVEYDFFAPEKNFTTSALKRFASRRHK